MYALAWSMYLHIYAYGSEYITLKMNQKIDFHPEILCDWFFIRRNDLNKYNVDALIATPFIFGNWQ